MLVGSNAAQFQNALFEPLLNWAKYKRELVLPIALLLLIL